MPVIRFMQVQNTNYLHQKGMKLKNRQRLLHRERHAKALEALTAVGLAKWAHHAPGELSGGQQQRVAIARALVGQPRILLADEPTGNLDSVRSREIAAMLQDFNRRQGLTIVMVTHEAEMAAYADRQIHFQDGTVTMDQQNGGRP